MGRPTLALLAGILLLFTLLSSPGERATLARNATSLHEFLELRASRHLPLPDPVGVGLPSLVTAPFGDRGLELLFAHLAEDPALVLDPLVGPWHAPGPGRDDDGFRIAHAAPDANAARTLLVLGDEALAAASDLPAVLVRDLPPDARGAGWVALDASTPGHSPLTQLAVLERFPYRAFDRVVAVWDLTDDLAQTDLLRRVHELVPPGGDVDRLLAELRDRERAPGVQELWLATHAEARAEVERVLVTAGIELDRRLALHGGDAVVALLLPDGDGLARTRGLATRVASRLRDRGVPVVVADPERLARGPGARLSPAGAADLVAAIAVELGD